MESTTKVHQHLEQVSATLGGPYTKLPRKATVAVLMKHGGFQILLRPAAMLSKLRRHLPGLEEAERAAMAVDLSKPAEMFFDRLEKQDRYGIPSELISYLTFPHEGKVYTEPDAPEAENPTIPAVFTFVGQFLDHDMTFNGLNLYDEQDGDLLKLKKDEAIDFASPQVDLDSVYGERNYGKKNRADPKTELSYEEIYHTDGRFKLRRLGPNAYDVRRCVDETRPNLVGSAYVYDPRNDENQVLLQIHLLLMRVHNKYLEQVYKQHPELKRDNKDDGKKAALLARMEVVHTWQRVLLDDYLPRVCKKSVLTKTIDEAKQASESGDWEQSGLKYKPAPDGTLKMVHEFAIAFRFGHSMLRTAYKMNGFGPVQLFNNRDLMRKGDLRGGMPLPMSHVVDWDVFFPENEFDSSLSLKIDTMVTPVVFDLPESTIPDAVKTTGNLPERNLVRSREIDVASGEDMAAYFGLTSLDRFEVEANDAAHYLFEADVDTYAHEDGTGEPPKSDPDKGFKDTRFKTPLWYYVLREAELKESGERLGELGSHIVAQVVVVGCYAGPFAQPQSYVSDIVNKSAIKLRDLIDYVNETPPEDV
jgi:hypothetical protein